MATKYLDTYTMVFSMQYIVQWRYSLERYTTYNLRDPIRSKYLNAQIQSGNI